MSDGQRGCSLVTIIVNKGNLNGVINGDDAPSAMLLMELLLGIQIPLRKLMLSPLWTTHFEVAPQVFQPWRMHCHMGGLAFLGYVSLITVFGYQDSSLEGGRFMEKKPSKPAQHARLYFYTQLFEYEGPFTFGICDSLPSY